MEEELYAVDEVVEKMCADNYFPGATYAVSNGKTNYIGFKGNKSLIPTVEKNSIDTLYDVASLTKVIVTNTILAKALQERKINLSDKLEKYLPEYEYLNVTIYDLATHSSGLPADLDTHAIHSNEELLKQLSEVKKTYETGTDIVYSDIGFILLGKALEKIYNKSLEELAIEKVFKPLDMNSSTFKPQREKTAPTELTKERGLVWGKAHDEKSYYSNSVLGHAGLFSTVDDIRKFTDMILNDGVVNGEVYLEKECLDLWFTPCLVGKDNIARSIGWIYGKCKCITGENVSENTISHTGFTGTSIVLDRDNKRSVILLSNRVHPARDNIKLIYDRHLLVDEVLETKIMLKKKINYKVAFAI